MILAENFLSFVSHSGDDLKLGENQDGGDAFLTAGELSIFMDEANDGGLVTGVCFVAEFDIG